MKESNWQALEVIISDFYSKKGIIEHLPSDINYLSKAYLEIESIWKLHYDQIDQINYVMLSEAPLWGSNRKYIYNPDINNSQFFYRSDLEYVLDDMIPNKTEFITQMNKMGLIILDISPFPLNQFDTHINYRSISKSDYMRLLYDTLPLFFAAKLDLIAKKKSKSIKFFYRYARVKKAFEDLISEAIVKKDLVASSNEIKDVSQIGGGIDRIKLNEIINN